MYGVFKFGSTAMMLQGEAAVQDGWTPEGNTTPFQLAFEILTFVEESVLLPPKVDVQARSVHAPDGTAATLSAVLFCKLPSCSRVAIVNTEYMRLYPARTTVVPLPVTSQAIPMRGEKFV